MQVLRWWEDARALHGQAKHQAQARDPWSTCRVQSPDGATGRTVPFCRGCRGECRASCQHLCSAPPSGVQTGDLGRPCWRYPDFVQTPSGEGQDKHCESWASSSACDVRLWSSSTGLRLCPCLFPSRNCFTEMWAHGDEMGFALHISLTFGREEAQELFKSDLGIRNKKKILYICCASLIFPSIAEASCKLHG